MENIIVIKEEQLADIVYTAVRRCFDEQLIGSHVCSSEEEGYYDRDGAMGHLHVSNSTLWRIEKAGLLKSKKVGRKNLYSKQEVNELVESGKLTEFNKGKN